MHKNFNVVLPLADWHLYCPPNGMLASTAEQAGLIVVPEGFADRRYRNDGSLVPRDQPAAVITNIREATAQALQITRHASVTTQNGTTIPLPARTLCVHGDGHHAHELLLALRNSFHHSGIQVACG